MEIVQAQAPEEFTNNNNVERVANPFVTIRRFQAKAIRAKTILGIRATTVPAIPATSAVVVLVIAKPIAPASQIITSLDARSGDRGSKNQ